MSSDIRFDSLFPDPQARRDGQPFELDDLWRPSALAPEEPTESLFPSPKYILPGPSAALPKDHDPTDFTFRASLPSRKHKRIASGNLFELPNDFKVTQAPFYAPNESSFFSEFSNDLPSSDADDGHEFSSVKDPEEPEEEDLWLAPEIAEAPEKSRVLTWDSFLMPDANNPENPFLSEAGPGVLDAAIEEYKGEDAGIVIREEVFGTCLLHMGLGRSSVLFRYDRKKNEFRPVKEKFRVSGCTTGTVESIIKTFAACGANTKKLQRFADSVYRDPSSSPSLVALAQCTTTIYESIQKRVTLACRTIKSIMHLHSLITEPALIIESFVRITDAAEGVRSDSELLSRHFEVIEQQQHRSGWMRPLLVETLARVSKPWVEAVEQWVGLEQRGSGAKLAEFVHAEEVPLMDESGKERMEETYTFVEEKVPSFISSETASTMFETGKSLRYLERYHPKHPLVPRRGGTKRPKLQWKFSWEDLDSLQAHAEAHERSLREEVEKYTAGTSRTSTPSEAEEVKPEASPFDYLGRSKEEIVTHLSTSSNTMSLPLPSLIKSDRLSNLVLTISSSTPVSAFAPPLSITPLLSFSHLLTSQSLLINKSTLHLFLHEHSLHTHLSYLRRFLLFTDGVFSARLASALFSAEVGATERTSAHRTTSTLGLRLGSRKTWPPASSELRLALSDVLSSLFDNNKDLPGGLSFTVRDMAPQEMDAVCDPNSISALDFLKIEYRPPAPLEAVITPTALYYYDKIFKFLLRLLRMVYVVNTTLWERTRGRDPDPAELKFCAEARHFVTTLSSYITTAGIGTTWSKFERRLEAITQETEKSSVSTTSLRDIRALHEGTLDRIMFAVLAKHKQKKLMEIIEEIFGVVLKFAAEGEEGGGTEKALRRLRRRVELFKGVCRGLGGKRRYGTRGREGEGYKEEAGLLGMLLLGLEMGVRGETGRV